MSNVTNNPLPPPPAGPPAHLPSLPAIAAWYAALNPQEKRVAHAYLGGQSHKEIAAALGVSYKTVSVHTYNLRAKAKTLKLRFTHTIKLEEARP